MHECYFKPKRQYQWIVNSLFFHASKTRRPADRLSDNSDNINHNFQEVSVRTDVLGKPSQYFLRNKNQAARHACIIINSVVDVTFFKTISLCIELYLIIIVTLFICMKYTKRNNKTSLPST